MQINISVQNNIPKEFIIQFFKSLTFVDDISFVSETETKKKTNKQADKISKEIFLKDFTQSIEQVKNKKTKPYNQLVNVE